MDGNRDMYLADVEVRWVVNQIGEVVSLDTDPNDQETSKEAVVAQPEQGVLHEKAA